MVCVLRLQDMEIQYRREKEEADLLLEQHRLVRAAAAACAQVTRDHVTRDQLLTDWCVCSTQTATAETTRTNAPARRAGSSSPP